MIICVVAVIIIAAIAGGGNDEGVKKVDGTGSNASGKQTQAAKTSANEGPLTFTVGETAQYKGINVTFVEVKENEGDTFNKPSDGNKFVLAVFEIENKSDEQFNFSSIMCSEAYYDGYSVDTSLLAGLGATESSLDGDCAPGKKLRGYLAYELPADYKELEIQLQLDIWDDEKIVFVYNND